jgi:hypothetical protein
MKAVKYAVRMNPDFHRARKKAKTLDPGHQLRVGELTAYKHHNGIPFVVGCSLLPPSYTPYQGGIECWHAF